MKLFLIIFLIVLCINSVVLFRKMMGEIKGGTPAPSSGSGRMLVFDVLTGDQVILLREQLQLKKKMNDMLHVEDDGLDQAIEHLSKIDPWLSEHDVNVVVTELLKITKDQEETLGKSDERLVEILTALL